MEKMERVIISIEDLRLWRNNPRYSLEHTIRIDKIGQSDFEIEEYNINKDNYSLIHKENIKKLLLNKDSISKTKDLIDSLKEGYDESKDQMFVVHPGFLDSYSSNDRNLKNIYYVVEGNRRLMCLDLILNYNNSRDVLEEIIKDNVEKINAIPDDSKDEILSRKKQLLSSNSDLKKILSIAIEAEEYFPETVIPCQVLDFDYYTKPQGIKQLNEMLNAKHFGERKGKMNWPRGLILAKIFGKIREFKRQEINKEITPKLVANELNSYMGKVVTSGDINASMLLCKSVDIWNIRNPDNKLEYWNTEEGDMSYYLSDVSYDLEGNEIKDATLSFSTSALELAKNNIKIFNKDFKLVVLSKIISFEYDLNKILGNDYLGIKNKDKEQNPLLSDADVNEILYEIIKGVVEHKVTTRSIKDETESDVGREIRNILYPINDLSPEKILNSTFDTFQYIPESISDNKTAIDLIKNLNELVKVDEIFNQRDLKDKNNVFLKTIYYIWKNEFGRIAKYKQKMKLKELPLMVISLLYRETYEFTLSLFYFYLTLDYWKNYEAKAKESKLFSRNGQHSEVGALALIVTNLILKSKILSLDNKPINENEFRKILEKEANDDANLNNIYSDLEQCFFVMIGDVNVPLEGEIDFKYFEKVKLDSAIKQMISEKKNYNASEFCKNNSDFYKSESAEILLNEFNYFSFSEDNKKTKNKIVLRFLENYDSDKENKYYVNRLIHKPLFALSIYELNEENAWYNEMNGFISFLIETSNILISLCED